MRFHPSYIAANWRCVTPVDPSIEQIGLAFNHAGGEPIRVRLPIADARQIVESLQLYLNRYAANCSQSLKSAEMPSVVVSIPEESDHV